MLETENPPAPLPLPAHSQLGWALAVGRSGTYASLRAISNVRVLNELADRAAAAGEQPNPHLLTHPLLDEARLLPLLERWPTSLPLTTRPLSDEALQMLFDRAPVAEWYADRTVMMRPDQLHELAARLQRAGVDVAVELAWSPAVDGRFVAAWQPDRDSRLASPDGLGEEDLRRLAFWPQLPDDVWVRVVRHTPFDVARWHESDASLPSFVLDKLIANVASFGQLTTVRDHFDMTVERVLSPGSLLPADPRIVTAGLLSNPRFRSRRERELVAAIDGQLDGFFERTVHCPWEQAVPLLAGADVEDVLWEVRSTPAWFAELDEQQTALFVEMAAGWQRPLVELVELVRRT